MKCAWDGKAFEPTKAQLGQRRRGRKLYCGPACREAAERDRASKWWRSAAGKRYNRERRARSRKEKEQ